MIKRLLYVFNRYETPYFCVAPNVMGSSITFKHNTVTVKIVLPDLSQYKRKGYERVHVDHWNKKHIPVCYWIRDVDVYVYIPDSINIYKDMLNKPPCLYDLVPEVKQRELNSFIIKYRKTSDHVFDLWVRTLRWKSLNGNIARQRIAKIRANFQDRLVDVNSQHHVWILPGVYSPEGSSPVIKKMWKQVEKSLQNNYNPPVYYDYLFDANEHIKLMELNRAIIDLAIASESYIRTLIINSIPKSLNNNIIKHVARTSIGQYIHKFVPNQLKASELASYVKIKNNISDMFEDRNSIAHSGKVQNMSVSTCEKYYDSVCKLLAIRDLHRVTS